MYGNSIRKDNGYDASSYTYYPVAIIGAGESGIAMGCRLKEVLGHDQFRIFDRQSGIGGTWWINRYPGVACDVYVFLPLDQQTSADVESNTDQPYSTRSPSAPTPNGLPSTQKAEKS